MVWVTWMPAYGQGAGSQGHLDVSEPGLSGIWTTAHTAFNESPDSYRTRLLSESFTMYQPDPTPTLRAHYYSSRDTAYPRSILSRAFYPASTVDGEATEYSLHWPVMLHQYLLYTGDEAYVRTLTESALPVMLQHFDGLTAESGLMTVSPGLSARAGESGSAIANMFYYRALSSAMALHQDLNLDPRALDRKERTLRQAILVEFWNPDLRFFVDGRDATTASVAVNALAICFGLIEPEQTTEAIALIRSAGTKGSEWYLPYIVEACFIAGETQLAIDLMSFVEDFSQNPSPLFLIPEYVFGVAPESPGWETIQVAPRMSDRVSTASLQVPLPDGRLSFEFDRELGVTVTIPVSGRVTLDGPEGLSMVVKKYRSHSMPESLTPEARAALDASKVAEFAEDSPFIWVSIDEQMLRIVRGDTVEYEARCASALKGIGSQMNSLQTPLGWHAITKKIGDDAPWGQVFRSRAATRKVWQPGEDTKEDLVLSRVLLLDGLEPGLNKGGNVDSLARNIYIHGTNDEAKIGIPSSHGCIRMINDDVIEMYDMIAAGMKVLITGTPPE